MHKYIIFIILVSCVLTGCWDRREVEERTSVVAIGIDLYENEQAPYLVSVQVPIPVKIAGGGGGGEGRENEAIRVISGTGKSVADAFNNIQKRMNQLLFIGHTRLLVLSEDVAKNGIEKVTDSFRRDPQIRRLLWPLVVEGKAKKVLESNPKLTQIPTVYIMDQLETGIKDERIPDITLGEYFINLSNPTIEPMLNYVEASKDDVKWTGLIVLDGDKMLGKLGAQESWMVMQLRDGKAGGNFLIYPDPNNRKHFLNVQPNQIDTKTKFSFPGERVKVEFSVNVQANIIEKSFNTDFSKLGNVEKLEKATAQALERRAKALIKKMQNEYKVDNLKIGSKIKAFHFREWQQMDWKDEFPNAEIDVRYEVKFRRTGMEMR